MHSLRPVVPILMRTFVGIYMCLAVCLYVFDCLSVCLPIQPVCVSLLYLSVPAYSNRFTRARPRGYAFVEFEKEEDMTSAYKKVRESATTVVRVRRRADELC